MVDPPSRVLLAGAGGFLGSAIARLFERESVAFEKAGRRSGIDLRDWERVKLLTRMDAILHFAGPASAPRFWDSPHECYGDHLLITLNLLELARQHGAR